MNVMKKYKLTTLQQINQKF